MSIKTGRTPAGADASSPAGTKVERDQLPAPRSLTPAQLRCVDLLLSGQSVSATANALGLHRQRISEWRKLPAFQSELARRRDELFVGLEVAEAGADAVLFLRQTVRDRYAPHRRRMAAARLLLKLFGRGLSQTGLAEDLARELGEFAKKTTKMEGTGVAAELKARLWELQAKAVDATPEDLGPLYLEHLELSFFAGDPQLGVKLKLAEELGFTKLWREGAEKRRGDDAIKRLFALSMDRPMELDEE